MMQIKTESKKSFLRWNLGIKRDMIALAIIWTVLVGASLFWTIHVQRKTTTDLALIQAQAGYERDQLFRRWGALHGGTYVPITKKTQPNPYLVVPEREIQTPTGKELTLVNPAYMMRQVHELGENISGIQGHLTSLMPLRPENAADSWESAALQAFEQGETERISIEMFRGEPHLRLMRPFVVEKACLKCHSHQGYKEGDIRGGISVSVAMAPLRAVALSANIASISWHLAFWVLGLVGIGLFQKSRIENIRELAANERKLSMITASTADAVVMMDPSGNAAYWNPAAEAMFGYKPEEILGQDIHQILTPKRYRDVAVKAHGRFLQTGAGAAIGKPVELEATKKDGTEFPMEMTLNAIEQEDGWWAIAIIRDITDRKLAEKEREQSRVTTEKILESMPVGVAIIGRDKVVRHMNSTALAMMGYNSPQEVQGQLCHKSFCPTQKCSCPVLDEGLVMDNGERLLIDKNQQEIPILKTVVPINIDDEEVLLETFIDISERKRAEKFLQEAKEVAEAANRTKSEFLAGMSHELRTPLTGILGFTDLLLNSDIDEEKRRGHLETVRSSGRHLLRLINDILDLSKIEVGQLTVERKPCAPHAILNDVTSIMRAQAQNKGIELHFDWTGMVPVSIETDASRFRQILLNLVGNAVKFTSRGAVRVVAHLETTEDSHQLLVDIIDSGVGIPEQKLESIFEPFVQADNSVTRKFGGTGLGLSISESLAQALGGGISVTSELGIGSKFTISVDAGDLAEVELLSAPPADGMQAGEKTLFPAKLVKIRSARVLLVEDGEINRKLVSTVLEQAGLSVDMAENGEIGVELVTRNDFDLILMDMQMPVLDGYAATRKLRRLGYEMPIVALTANAMKGDQDECLAAGCSHYVSKPIDISRLLATVSEALGQETESQGGELSGIPSSEGFVPMVSSLPTDDPVFQEIEQDFVKYIGGMVKELRQATGKQELVRLAELAHSLVGTAGTAGFDAFTRPAKELEMMAKLGDLENVEPVIEELEEMAGRVLVSVRG